MAVDEVFDAELPAVRIMTGVPLTVQQTMFGLVASCLSNQFALSGKRYAVRSGRAAARFYQCALSVNLKRTVGFWQPQWNSAQCVHVPRFPIIRESLRCRLP